MVDADVLSVIGSSLNMSKVWKLLCFLSGLLKAIEDAGSIEVTEHRGRCKRLRRSGVV